MEPELTPESIRNRRSKSVAAILAAASEGAKVTLKKLRVSQPFNVIATCLVKWGMSGRVEPMPIVVKHLHRVGLVSSRLPNGRLLKLASRADDWVSNQVYWRGWQGYERETVPLFFRLASRARITLDVGAYVGFYSLVAAHANTNGRVYAFEPLANARERLCRNLDLNQLSNVHVVDSAVGALDEAAKFYCTATPLPCSSSLSYEFMRSAEDVYSLPVAVVTLDRFVRENALRGVDLVKIDTESTEPQELQGMIETITHDQPFIFCEVLKGRGSEAALEQILSPLGYNFYLLTQDGPELRDHIEGHPDWLNYLFTPLPPDEVAKL